MDQKLLFLINSKWTSPALDSFMATLSCFAAWVPVLVIIGVMTVALGGFKARAMLAVMVLVVVFMNSVVSQGIKVLVNRPRPREALENVRIVDLQPGTFRFLSIFKPAAVSHSPAPAGNPHGHSFPSSHTVNNFCAATILGLFYKKRGWLYFIPAALVGYSRIYTGAHWPSDVFVSVFLAIGAALLLVTALEMAWRKFGGRIAPAIFAAHPSLTGEAAA